MLVNEARVRFEAALDRNPDYLRVTLHREDLREGLTAATATGENTLFGFGAAFEFLVAIAPRTIGAAALAGYLL